MEVCEYLSIRRAYYHVRQETPSSERLPFEEVAILAKLSASGPMKTSDIAEYQGALRPTMTHRTNHLTGIGFIERSQGSEDLRNVVCSITDAGEEYLTNICKEICAAIPHDASLHRISPARVRPYLVAMGGMFLSTSDICLLALSEAAPDGLTVTGIVGETGLLQPTASMAVSSLESAGSVSRKRRHASTGRAAEPPHGHKAIGALITLTDEGTVQAQTVHDGVKRLVVHSKRRRNADKA